MIVLHGRVYVYTTVQIFHDTGVIHGSCFGLALLLLSTLELRLCISEVFMRELGQAIQWCSTVDELMYSLNIVFVVIRSQKLSKRLIFQCLSKALIQAVL